MFSGERQDQILQWLQEKGSLTIDQLVKQLSVSVMTIHRDLDTLVSKGLAVKVHGGVTLPERFGKPAHFPSCALCGLPIQERTAFTIQLESGELIQACCPHCGFLLMAQHEGRGMVSALTKDFLYGRTTLAAQAVYVLESQVTLCCVPSVLSFASREDAAHFQKGFGGELIAGSDVYQHLVSHRGDGDCCA